MKYRFLCTSENAVIYGFKESDNMNLVGSMSMRLLEVLEERNPDTYYKIQSAIDAGAAVVAGFNNKCGYLDVDYGADGDLTFKAGTFMQSDLDSILSNTVQTGAAEMSKDRLGTYKSKDVDLLMYRASDYEAGSARKAAKDDIDLEAMEKAFDKQFENIMNTSDEEKIESSTKESEPIHKEREEYKSVLDEQDETLSGAVYAAGDQSALLVVKEQSFPFKTMKMIGKMPTVLTDTMAERLNCDFDLRVPHKYVPCTYNGVPCFLTVSNDEHQYSSYAVEQDALTKNYYRIYPLITEGIEVYPDILIDVLTKNSNLRGDADWKDGLHLTAQGFKNFFDDEKVKEQRAEDVELFKTFFQKNPGYRVHYISWSTGCISALTPDMNQVLLIAGEQKARISNSTLETFIPLSEGNKLGVVVIGANYKEYLKLAQP
jgi:hypothetical protein